MPEIRSYLQTENARTGDIINAPKVPIVNAPNGAIVNALKKPIPTIIGPTYFIKWATANRGNYQRGETSLAQLSTMLKNLFDIGAWPSRAISISSICITYDVGAPYIGELIHLAKCIAGGTAVEAFSGDAAATVSDYHMARLRKVSKMMLSFAMNMQNSAYPACKHYYTVTPSEAADYLTQAFTTKHVSSTEDESSTRRVAQIRGAQEANRGGVLAFGHIITRNSGGLLKGELAEFRREIKARQKEFTDTYVELTQFFADKCELLGNGGVNSFDVLIDHVTFITKRKFKMYEYVDGRGGEACVYIHFGVSATADGKKWAVHHLARTTETRIITAGKAVTSLSCPSADATTSAHNPY